MKCQFAQRSEEATSRWETCCSPEGCFVTSTHCPPLDQCPLAQIRRRSRIDGVPVVVYTG